MKLLAIIPLLLCIGVAQAAPERKSLDGWGPFKFSMSMAQAMAATRGMTKTGAPDALEYPCTVAGQAFTAIVKFTDDDARVRYINLVYRDTKGLDDKALAAEYDHLIEVLTGLYGQPDTRDAPVYGADRALGSAERLASTMFKFTDGGSIGVEENVSWLPHILVRYTPSSPHEGF